MVRAPFFEGLAFLKRYLTPHEAEVFWPVARGALAMLIHRPALVSNELTLTENTSALNWNSSVVRRQFAAAGYRYPLD